MKEKRSKKESNKEKAEKENRSGLVDSRVEKNEALQRRDLAMDWDAFIRYYNSILKFYGSAIEPLKRISKGYRSRIQAMVNNEGNKHFLGDAIANMAKSDVLNGRKNIKGKPFIASFTWLFGSDEIFDKVADGFYNNAPEQAPTAAELRQQRADEREEARRERERIAREEYEREHERMEKERERWAREAATPEQIREIMAQFKLPRTLKKPENGA